MMSSPKLTIKLNIMKKGKIVINACFGGFGLSKKARKMLKERTGISNEHSIERQNPILVDIVEGLGKKANSEYSKLVVMEVDYGRKFIIHEYDGSESLMFLDEVEWITLQ